MKPSAYITIMFIVTLVFTSIFYLVTDFQSNYPDVEVNTTWKEKYDYMEGVTGVKATNATNETKSTGLYKIQEKLQNLGTEKGFIPKLIAGGYVIALATVTAIIHIIVIIPFIMGFMADVLISIGVPTWATAILGIMILSGVIFALVSTYRRYPM